jgi:hypothetical protein
LAAAPADLAGQAMEFINISPTTAFAVASIGFLGGTLSGFLGSGGAFVMTPAMMALGVPGLVAVSSNLAHKFGKAIVGARKHSKMGNVDAKLGVFMVIFLMLGVKLAVFLNKYILGTLGESGSNLYISIVFVVLLTGLALFMIQDIRKYGPNRSNKDNTPTQALQIAQKLQQINIPPMIYFKVANIRISLWFPALVALATGWLAGTVGVGGFIGVPAMIYLLGIPTRIAAGTELFLAIFSGAFGSFQYALNGFVDIRLVMLLYLGSLVGLQIGANATRMVDESKIKLVMAIVIGLAAISRGFAIPKYLSQLNYINLSNFAAQVCSIAANITLFGGAIMGTLLILLYVFRYRYGQSKYTDKKERADYITGAGH